MGQFTAVAVTCAVALILQCALLLYTTYAKSINTVAALVIIIIVEVLPGLVRFSLFHRFHRSNARSAGSRLQCPSASRDERLARHRVVLLLSGGIQRAKLEHRKHRHRQQRRKRRSEPTPRQHRKRC